MSETSGAPVATSDASDLLRWAELFAQLASRVRGAPAQLDTEIDRALGAVDEELLSREPRVVFDRVPRVELDPRSVAAASLLATYRARERAAASTTDALRLAEEASARLAAAIPPAQLLEHKWRLRLARASKKAAAQTALDLILALRAWAERHDVAGYFERSLLEWQLQPAEASGRAPWADFAGRRGWYLGQVASSRRQVPFVSRWVPAAELASLVQLGEGLRGLQPQLDRARQRVAEAFGKLRQAKVDADLAQMPLATIKDVTEGRLRLGPIEKAGYTTVLSVSQVSEFELESIPGVGEMTARQVYAAARQLTRAVTEDVKFRIDLDPSHRPTTELLTQLHALIHAQDAMSGVPIDDLSAAASELGALQRIRPVPDGFTAFIGRPSAEAQQFTAESVDRWRPLVERGIARRVGEAAASFGATSAGEVWADFQRRSPDYYTLLGDIVGLKLGDEVEAGFLPKEIVARVHDQPLDDAFRRVSLRGYQSFGARFALVQRKAMIGDEMGLGKTIQAIAAIAHLKSVDAGRFLVVCPASLLINWTREVQERSSLRVHYIHGPQRESALRRWKRGGDVGVTTYETLRSLDLDGQKLAMLVVDEAHYVKNPHAQRSRSVQALVRRADRCLFLTGTPMENRVDEFRELVAYLQPQLASSLDRNYYSPEGFRQAVAPAYLRRNQEDVLAELPEMVLTEEWLQFSAADEKEYRLAVAEGNFMAMRRAAFSDPARSAKMHRLREIVAEANDNGHKVIVFSFFRDVLDSIRETLGQRALGPLTGSVAAGKRQQLVDEFSKDSASTVLLSQIQAGGVGLNMQAGSVVILCEPQVKPTLEAQAIARAHRMGQLRTVQVHRLLVADSVDQRMVEILNSKAQLFDEYARRSDLAGASPEAVDISEASLAKTIVQEEQRRLAIEVQNTLGAR